MSGFKQLVTHLASVGDTVTVPDLAQVLQRLQHFDALLLLWDHFILSQAQDCQCEEKRTLLPQHAGGGGTPGTVLAGGT